MKLHPTFNRFMAPAGGDGQQDGGAAATDRGDDFTPTEDDTADDDNDASTTEPKAKAEPKAKPAKEGLRAEAAADPEPEADDDAKAETDEDKARKDTRVPLKRHKELLDKERSKRQELEQRLARYEQGQQVAQVNEKITEDETKLLALEKDYSKLLEDGKVSEAAAKMAELRKLERQITEQKTALTVAAAEARAIETMRYNTTLERVEAAYPALNQDHDDYDAEKVKEVLQLKAGLQLQGSTPAEALQKAVRYVMGAPETTRQEAAVTAKARVDKDEAAALAAREAKAAERKEAAAKKGIDTALKTPPSTSKVGIDSDKLGGVIDAKAVMKMDFKDFSKLDEATLARMRGDEYV